MNREEFRKFLEKDTDRKAFIMNFLAERNVNCSVMTIKGKNHIAVNFPKSAYDSSRKVKTVLAHYDRVSGSEGANDNSFAAFTLMEWAVSLSRRTKAHNVRLIFTDGEETAESGENFSVKNQGAFGLAQIFKKLNMTNEEIYVFDCMGRGTVPVLIEMDFPEDADRNFLENYRKLSEKTVQILRRASGGLYEKLPASYSDNAGFIASGLPSVAVTMLPVKEAKEYAANLSKIPELKAFVRNNLKVEKEAEESFKSLIPLTWRLINSEDDRIETLSKASEEIFDRILEDLAEE